MRLETMLWLFPVVTTLHNIEEAIWLPGWWRNARWWHKPVAPEVFRFAVVVLTILAYAITLMAVCTGRQTVWMHLMFGFMAAMLMNAVIPHLAATIITRRYMPGLGTGLFLNVPVLSTLVWFVLKQDYVGGWWAVTDCITVSILLLLSIPVLFRLGEIVTVKR